VKAPGVAVFTTGAVGLFLGARDVCTRAAQTLRPPGRSGSRMARSRFYSKEELLSGLRRALHVALVTLPELDPGRHSSPVNSFEALPIIS
jgi:hypothetical protein